MHVTLFGVVLFLHITVALIAFGMAGVMHTALNVVGRGRSVAELRPWASVMHRIEPLFPVMALLLLVLGSWLVHLGRHTDDAFSFSTGWILTAIITLVAIEAAGGAVLAPHGKKLTGLIHEAPDGAVSDEIVAAARRPLFWDLAHLTTFGFVGVVFLMAAKPSAAWAPVFPIAGAVLGVVLSRIQLAALPRADAAVSVPGQRGAAQSGATQPDATPAG
jgi:hypothetical protein